MNRRKEVVRMAKDAGLGQHIPADRGMPGIWVGCDLSALERFASLVAAAERELPAPCPQCAANTIFARDHYAALAKVNKLESERDALQAKVAEQSVEISELRNRLSQKMNDCVKAEHRQENDAEKYWEAREMLVARTQQHAERIAELEEMYKNVAFNAKYFKSHYEKLGESFNDQAELIEKCEEALRDYSDQEKRDQWCGPATELLAFIAAQKGGAE